jgi:hypothetical protein
LGIMTEDDDPAAADPARPERVLADLAALAIAILCVVITVTIVSRWLYRGIVPDDVLIVRETDGGRDPAAAGGGFGEAGADRRHDLHQGN